MRVFVAVDLDTESRKKITEIEKSLKDEDFDIKFVEPDNLHITLKFLGEVCEDDVKEIENIISEAAQKTKRFTISIKGAGYFGNRSHIKTIW
ncbi:MAG: RNA 2',3'-cyclic phosphodiesterase, partial [Candidatus Aenigmatarchaeota archaeon]